MGWSEFLYLAVGLGLGWGVKEMLPKKAGKPSKLHAQPEPTTPSEQLSRISDELKHTQLAYRMALEMSQFKAGFLARTSHELRSPINSIIGTLQLILSDLCESPEEEKEFIQQAYTSALKLVERLDEIIKVAKTDHGTEKMNIQPLSLAEMFEEVEKLTHLQAANHSIRLKFQKPDSQVRVLADKPRLRQVLMSLVDTAIANMEEGSVIVSCDVVLESKLVYIWVDDQRPVSGWSESWDLLQSTFEKSPLETALTSVSRTEAHQLSPGMRLLMNQTLIALMNGSLEVVAIPTEGEDYNFTRTQCSLPLA
ncbi:MAG: HAMP domain-containing sensor histidine kinase [Lyngbya sp.]|nr:HAMP domain-containing sensor histidine kinase [Lyngbya sp.]